MKTYLRNGVWYYDITVNGKRIQKTTKRPRWDRAGADRVMKDAYDKAMNRSQLGDKDSISLAEAFDKTIANARAKGHSPSTLRQYELAKKQWLGIGKPHCDRWHLDPDTMMDEVTDLDLEDHKENRIEEGLKNGSTNIQIRVLRLVIRKMSKRYAGPGQLEFEQLPAFVKTRWLRKGEVQEIEALLIERCKTNDPHGYCQKALDLFYYVMGTGVRISEALSVEWSYIDLENGLLEIWREKTKSISHVPLSAELVANLKARHNQPKPFVSMDRAVKLLREYIALVGNRDPKQVERHGRATIHTLRDTYATELLSKGLTMYELSHLLGHKSESMSKKYGHIKGPETTNKARMLLNDGR